MPRPAAVEALPRPGLDQHAVVAHTRRWLAAIVIGLNLCPFARRVFEANSIRYVVTEAPDTQSLFQDLTDELQALVSAPVSQVETTLLIHPYALANFRDYTDFVGDGERLVDQLGLSGTIQIAGFHPAYQFAGTDPDDVENYTNRSPYPMLHLLREQSLTAIADDPDELAAIPRRNVTTLKKLGLERMLAKLDAIMRGDPPIGSTGST